MSDDRVALRAEIERLAKRLEVNTAAPDYDGIACRDETIRNLTGQRDRLAAELAATRRLAIDRLKTIKGLNKRVGVR